MANTAASNTGTAVVQTETEAFQIILDVLSVLEDEKLTYQVAGNGFSDSINLAMYQLKGIAPATTSAEATSAYPWSNIPKSQMVEHLADMALEAIALIEQRGGNA
tara:strand:- start:74 stop:388 length:315 start_codon:yes stop_codon:yes gene_type:complete